MPDSYRRAGRFGTKGLAITFVANDENEGVLTAIQSRFEVAITELPETIEASTYSASTILCASLSPCPLSDAVLVPLQQ